MAAAAVLAVVGVLTVVVDRLRKVRDISTDDIEREADAAIENDEFVGDRLTKLYRATARKRAAAIDERSDWLNGHSGAAVVVIVLVVAEIVVTLLARAA